MGRRFFSLEKKNIIFEEASSDEEGIEKNNMCLLEKTNESSQNSSSSSFRVNLAQATKNNSSLDWDRSSIYQVSKFANYFDNEKTLMFFDPVKVSPWKNQTKIKTWEHTFWSCKIFLNFQKSKLILKINSFWIRYFLKKEIWLLLIQRASTRS